MSTPSRQGQYAEAIYIMQTLKAWHNAEADIDLRRELYMGAMAAERIATKLHALIPEPPQ